MKASLSGSGWYWESSGKTYVMAPESAQHIFTVKSKSFITYSLWSLCRGRTLLSGSGGYWKSSGKTSVMAPEPAQHILLVRAKGLQPTICGQCVAAGLTFFSAGINKKYRLELKILAGIKRFWLELFFFIEN